MNFRILGASCTIRLMVSVLRKAVHELEGAVKTLARLGGGRRSGSPGQGGNPGDWYFNRGKSDALRGKGAIFRRKGSRLVAEGDDSQSDEWEDWKREDYMLGYDFGLEEIEESVDGSPKRNLWSHKVKTRGHLPPGLFTKSARTIASTLRRSSRDERQAMSRLNFYENRAGKNLTGVERKKLEDAKRILARSDW